MNMFSVVVHEIEPECLYSVLTLSALILMAVLYHSCYASFLFFFFFWGGGGGEC